MSLFRISNKVQACFAIALMPVTAVFAFASTAHAYVLNRIVPEPVVVVPTPEAPSDIVSLDPDLECFTTNAKTTSGAPFNAWQRYVRNSLFLHHATFGPTFAEMKRIDDLNGDGQKSGYCDWLAEQYQDIRPSLSRNLRAVLTETSDGSAPSTDVFVNLQGTSVRFGNGTFPNFKNTFWVLAGTAPDQLRQRMAYALSQIIVVSDAHPDLAQFPFVMADYADRLRLHALGNYFDLLEDITYSPAMAVYLTYINSSKSDPNIDENYAREIMQLFTIGLDELRMNGRPVLENGVPREAYDPIEDVNELAKIFTGFHFEGQAFGVNLGEGTVFPRSKVEQQLNLAIDAGEHEGGPVTLLGTTINSGLYHGSQPQSCTAALRSGASRTAEENRVRSAINILREHQNSAPFISRQLIQRFVSSAPSIYYTLDVARVFEAGKYTMPNGVVVGTGCKGDLMATIAAILLHPQARLLDTGAENKRIPPAILSNQRFVGKFKEPSIRLLNWARAFGVENYNDTHSFEIGAVSSIFRELNENGFGQEPFSSPSVFNFYRPGYVPPENINIFNSLGALNVTVPELQILNDTTAFGIINIMEDFILQRNEFPFVGPNRFLAQFYAGAPFRAIYAQSNDDNISLRLTGDFDEDWIAIANNKIALTNRLNLVLTGGLLDPSTTDTIRSLLGEDFVDDLDETDPDRLTEAKERRRERLRLAIYLVTISTEFIYTR